MRKQAGMARLVQQWLGLDTGGRTLALQALIVLQGNRLKTDLIARAEHRSIFRVLVPQGNRRASNEMQAAGRGHWEDAGHLPGHSQGASRNSGARGIAARQAELLGEIAEVGEPRKETE